MKQFKGDAIYNPSGHAGEYSCWACNFFTGCSNDCAYCYCKRGVMSSVWSTTPKLKKCFKDENHALDVFEKELMKNLPELQKYGIFFSFTTDPMLLPIINITTEAVIICLKNNVPVKILTKRAEWIDNHGTWSSLFGKDRCFPYHRGVEIEKAKQLIAFGFTLTGHDELEPNASPNIERIKAMKNLHNAGFKTWASIEPIIDFYSSRSMINECVLHCDLFKIGLQSGKKYDRKEERYMRNFVKDMPEFVGFWNKKAKIYFKDSLLQQAGISRESLPENCVGRDHNIFEN